MYSQRSQEQESKIADRGKNGPTRNGHTHLRGEWHKTKNGIAIDSLTEEFFEGVQVAIGCCNGERSKNIRCCGDRSGGLRGVDGVASRQTRPARGAGRGLRCGASAGEFGGRNAHHSNGLWRG